MSKPLFSLLLRIPLLLLLLLLLLHGRPLLPAAHAHSSMARLEHLGRALLPINCPGSCDVRCSQAGNAKRCKQYCNICCNQCACVPPGTFGNKEVCPCYANLKNSKGTSKCP